MVVYRISQGASGGLGCESIFTQEKKWYPFFITAIITPIFRKRCDVGRIGGSLIIWGTGLYYDVKCTQRRMGELANERMNRWIIATLPWYLHWCCSGGTTDRHGIYPKSCIYLSREVHTAALHWRQQSPQRCRKSNRRSPHKQIRSPKHSSLEPNRPDRRRDNAEYRRENARSWVLYRCRAPELDSLLHSWAPIRLVKAVEIQGRRRAQTAAKRAPSRWQQPSCTNHGSVQTSGCYHAQPHKINRWKELVCYFMLLPVACGVSGAIGYQIGL